VYGGCTFIVYQYRGEIGGLSKTAFFTFKAVVARLPRPGSTSVLMDECKSPLYNIKKRSKRFKRIVIDGVEILKDWDIIPEKAVDVEIMISKALRKARKLNKH
jgi:hypothetical protein